VPPEFLYTIEQTAFSTWLRDSQSVFGYWLVIACHAIGMGLLVGMSAIVALRLLGVARDQPLPALRRVYPLIWAGFWIQLVTGVVLVVGYPTKSFMTPAFHVKMVCIAAAMVVMVRLEKRLAVDAGGQRDAGGRPLAIASLVLWFGALAAGRLIAYTAEYSTYPG
jgi:hypothetical protein